jgi:hypothetical protein
MQSVASDYPPLGAVGEEGLGDNQRAYLLLEAVVKAAPLKGISSDQKLLEKELRQQARLYKALARSFIELQQNGFKLEDQVLLALEEKLRLVGQDFCEISEKPELRQDAELSEAINTFEREWSRVLATFRPGANATQSVFAFPIGPNRHNHLYFVKSGDGKVDMKTFRTGLVLPEWLRFYRLYRGKQRLTFRLQNRTSGDSSVVQANDLYPEIWLNHNKDEHGLSVKAGVNQIEYFVRIDNIRQISFVKNLVRMAGLESERNHLIAEFRAAQNDLVTSLRRGEPFDFRLGQFSIEMEPLQR